ncbi:MULTISPECIES: hypothetical protein [unclassified Streptomyces]|uniref:hypothetical protein n=1 Tax=unclassified Streptomyces TaxID=2593676 RepID=UPI0033B59F4B
MRGLDVGAQRTVARGEFCDTIHVFGSGRITGSGSQNDRLTPGRTYAEMFTGRAVRRRTVSNPDSS